MIRSARTFAASCATLLVLGLAACGGDDEGGTGLDGAITITLGSSTITLTQGNAGTVNVTVGRLNGFTGAIAVTAENLPTGVTAPAISIADGQTTGTLNVTVAATAAAATTALTVRATAAGVTAVTAPLSLVVQAAPAQGFSMSLSPATVTVQAGNTGTSNLTITRTGGFAASVALTATGAPTGMTVTFNPASTTGTTSAISVATTAAVAAGNSTITVRGNATGVAEQTATLTVTVTAGAGAFTLSLNPTTASVAANNSTSIAINIARTGSFTGPVALAATGLPTGVTASFNPASATGTSSTLTLTAGATAPSTTSPATVTVTGTGTGAANQTATLALTVQGTSGGGGNVSVAFCPSTGVPVWVAFQDGTNAWQQATAVNGVYSANVTSGRGGVAYVTPQTGGGFQTTVRYGSTAELGQFNQIFCSGLTGTGKTVNVTTVGVGATDAAFMALGSSISVAFPGTPTQPFQNVPDGSLDLLGARAVISQTGSITINKLFAQRGITPAANSTVTVDFNGSNALDPVTGALTINGLGADQGIFGGFYFSTSGSSLPLSLESAASASTTRTLSGFPPVAGSFHVAQVTVQASDRARTQSLFYSTVGAKTLNLSPDLGAPTVTAAATSPILRLQAVIPSVAPYNTSWNVTFGQGTGASTRRVYVQTTAAYVGTVGATVTAAVPDLGSSYQTTWGLTDASTTWTVQASALAGFAASGLFQDGATITSASRSGTYAPEQN